jgi:hypothetical protein
MIERPLRAGAVGKAPRQGSFMQHRRSEKLRELMQSIQRRNFAAAGELLRAVRAGNSLQICESCGRILVWTVREAKPEEEES